MRASPWPASKESRAHPFLLPISPHPARNNDRENYENYESTCILYIRNKIFASSKQRFILRIVKRFRSRESNEYSYSHSRGGSWWKESDVVSYSFDLTFVRPMHHFCNDCKTISNDHSSWMRLLQSLCPRYVTHEHVLTRVFRDFEPGLARATFNK